LTYPLVILLLSSNLSKILELQLARCSFRKENRVLACIGKDFPSNDGVSISINSSLEHGTNSRFDIHRICRQARCCAVESRNEELAQFIGQPCEDRFA